MTPFIRRVSSITAIRNSGTDESFFKGQDFATIPSFLTEIIDEWCKHHELGNTSLPSKDAPSEQSTDVYYIALRPAARAETKSLLSELAPHLISKARLAVETLSEKTLFSSSANDAMDSLSEASSFRDALMRMTRKTTQSEKPDPALVIYT